MPVPSFLIAVLALAIALLVIARLCRRQVFGFLEDRNSRAAIVLVGEYLARRAALDSAAARLNRMLDRIVRYHHLSMPPGPPGSGTLTAITLVPEGYSAQDPQVKKLYHRAFELRVGPGRYREMQEHLRQKLEEARHRQASEDS
jgi:hypothetical protein